MNIMLLTGDDIKEIRQAKGMNLKQFGELLGVEEATVSRWESGHRHPRIPMYFRLNELRDGLKKKNRKRNGDE